MPVGDYGQSAVCTARPDETLRAAAQRMEKHGVGSLVVVEDERPVGVLTDRDVVLHVLAERRNADATSVRSAVARSAVTVPETAGLAQAADLMRRHRLRRLPMVGPAGEVVGVISADDLVRLLAQEITGLARVSASQLPVSASAGAEAAGTAAAALEAPVRTRLAEHYHREVQCLRADTSARALAELMKAEAVGCVVVTGDGEDAIGIVTDRDLATRVVAAGVDPDATLVSTIMSAPPVTAEATERLQDVVARMGARGVRRLPVLSGGRAVGMVTYDDLLVAFGQELAQLGEAVRAEVQHEKRAAQAERAREAVETRLRELGGRVAELGAEAAETLREELDDLWKRIRRS